MRNSSNYKPQKENIQKWGSILLIAIFICSGILIIMPSNLRISTAKDTSTSTEASVTDFFNGTFDNLTLIGSGSEAELRLDLIELNKWTNNIPSIDPGQRQASAMATIWGTDKVLLFGGIDGSSNPFDNTWIYDLSDNNWTNMKPITHPSYRSGHAMASIYGTDKVVLVGGIINITSPTVYNETWIYDLSNNIWINVTVSNNPGKIHSHGLASIYGTDNVVLFIGSKGVFTNETWIYDFSENSWTKKSPANSPGIRSLPSMASIYGTDKVMIFAGFNNNNDTWVYDLSDNNWTRMAFGPGGRYQHAMASIYGTDKIVLFGGFNIITATDFNDTWLYDFSEDTWTELDPISYPYAMISHVMATVWGTDKIVLYNGPGLYWFNDTWVFELDDYVKNGTFISPPFKFGPNSSLKEIIWVDNNTFNTSIKFQLRSAKTEIGLFTKDFIGPNGLSSTFYSGLDETIWFGHHGDSWVQYKAYFFTNNDEETPILRNVTITYNHWPNTTLINPNNNSIINKNKPTFEWLFTDSDSTNQSGFQVVIDDNVEFSSADYDSNEQSSPNRSWQFPNGTGYTEITDGIWYWKVRTKDSDGDWGHYSVPWKFRVDTITPNSMITVPVNGFFNKINTISGIASDSLDGIGLNQVEIAINRHNDESYWTGQKWADSKSWLITSGTTKWTYDTNSVIWHSGFKYNIQSRAIDNATNIEIPKTGKIITIDFYNVTFSNASPSFSDVSTTEDVEVGITISDQISGVNASTIEYIISEDESKTWTSWKPVLGLESGRSVNLTLNLTFPNGTGNRIKWRASDIAGNGPKESKIYLIKVNTWLQQFIPKVKLWVPPNGSIIPSTSVELSWRLENPKLKNVTYDIYLGTMNPPNTTIENGHTKTSLFAKDLSDGETYYWTVIPKVEKFVGWCRSGIWSFTINTSVPYPRVKLIFPENGSIINSPRPTLQWSVEYLGIEELSYNIYLDTNQSPIDFEKSSNNYYMPNYILNDNTTYYWKIVPWAGNVKGLESETWSFIIKKDYIPKFGINLTIDPAEIELEPSGMTTVKAKVTNLGELTDSISLSVEIPAETDIGAIVNEPSIISTAPENIAIFNITVTATEDIEPGVVILVVTATSEKAVEYGKIIEVKETFKVITSEPDKPEIDKSSDDFLIWIIIIIIIIIILALVILILMRRKKQAQEEMPIKSPTPEKVQDKVSVPSSDTQLPTKPTVDTASQLTPTTTPKPTLEASPSMGPVHVEKQMPEVQQTPQLPLEEKQNNKNDTTGSDSIISEDPSPPSIQQESKK